MNWLFFSVAAVLSYPQRFLLWTSGDLHKIPFFIRHGFYYSRKTSYIIIQNKKKYEDNNKASIDSLHCIHNEQRKKAHARGLTQHTQRATQLHKKNTRRTQI